MFYILNVSLSTWIRICISNAVLDPNAIEYCTDRNPKQKHWTWTDTTVMVTDLKFLFVLSLLLTFIFWWTNAFHLYSISFILTLFTLKTAFLLCSVHFIWNQFKFFRLSLPSFLFGILNKLWFPLQTFLFFFWSQLLHFTTFPFRFDFESVRYHKLYYRRFSLIYSPLKQKVAK